MTLRSGWFPSDNEEMENDMNRETITALMAKKNDTIEVRQAGETKVFHVLGTALLGTKVCMEVLQSDGGVTFISLGASEGIVLRSVA